MSDLTAEAAAFREQWERDYEVKRQQREAEREQQAARLREQQAARERVTRFLDAWEGLRDRGDMIYGLGVKAEEDTRDLLVSDLRLLLGEIK